MLLTEVFEKTCQAFAPKTALVMRTGYRTTSLTYQEVLNLALQIACFLQNRSIAKQDKVLLLSPNSPFWICVFWGCLIRGAVLVPLNTQSTEEMVEKIAAQTKAKLIFKHLNFKQKLPDNLLSYDLELIREEVANLDGSNFPISQASEHDLVEILYTSGTTGEPKGVMLTHQNLCSNLESLARVIPLSPKDKFLSILPLSHIFEQVAGFLVPFKSGAEIIYAHSKAAIKDLMKQHRVTHMAAVPEFLRIVMSKIEARAGNLLGLAGKLQSRVLRRLIMYPVLKQFGGKLETVASGGAPLDPELEKKWEALGITLLQGYGLTETSPVVSTNTYAHHCLGSVGRILPGVKLKIAADGEILVQGPNVFAGYYQNIQKTKEAFTADGWFKTGDIGELAEDGFLYLRGRKKYMILGPGGQNVFPEDIEFELNKIIGIKDSCVVGLPQPGGQVAIHAVLLPASPARSAGGPAGGGKTKNPEPVIEQANKNLASYQQITGWSSWPGEDFPRSATRKVKKDEVLNWLLGKVRQKTKEGLPPTKTPLQQLLAELVAIPPGREINSTTKIVPELNLDSLLRIELVTRIEEKFGISLEETQVTPSTTLAGLEALLQTTPPAPKKLALKNWPISWWARAVKFLGQNLLIFPAAKLFLELKVQGQDQLKTLALPAIFMPNHLSYLDSLVIAMAMPATIRKRLAFAAARDVLYQEYWGIAPLAELLFNAFPFPRREGENIKSGLETMGRLLDKNYSIVVYPEGQISQSGKLLPLKRGAGLVAQAMDCWVVPVKIIGTSYVLPYAKILPRRRGMVQVKFGQPMKFSQKDSYLQITEKIQQTLQAM